MTDDDADKLPRSGHERLIPALAVIAVGVFFLLGNLGIDWPFFDWNRWWAWFILLAAAWPLGDAWARYRRLGHADALVWQELLSASAIVLVALMLIVPLSWARWWPLFVIYGGVCMLVRGPRRQRSRSRW